MLAKALAIAGLHCNNAIIPKQKHPSSFQFAFGTCLGVFELNEKLISYRV